MSYQNPQQNQTKQTQPITHTLLKKKNQALLLISLRKKTTATNSPHTNMNFIYNFPNYQSNPTSQLNV